MPKRIALVSNSRSLQGTVEVRHGVLEELRITDGPGRADGTGFVFSGDGPNRLEMTFSEVRLQPGPNATLVTLRTGDTPFSFFLRDVSGEHPIFIPAFGTAITEADDTRPHSEIAAAIQGRGTQTALQRLTIEPEESFEAAARHTRRMRCQTWLGLSRDFRTFGLDFRGDGQDTGSCPMWDWIEPRYHGRPVPRPEADGRAVRYSFMLGRGFSCVHDLTRRLESGVLPMLNGELKDGDILYSFTAFVSLESGPLTAQSLRGTHFMVADGHGGGHMFTPEQQAEFDQLVPAETGRDEETVLYFRVEATNPTPVPRYAWFKGPFPEDAPYSFDGETGFGSFPSGGVFCVAKLDSRPLAQEEFAVLLRPGQTVTLEFSIPHSPLPAERAACLARQDFSTRRDECRAFWQGKLESAARIRLPERRLDEMVHAGLLHLDLVAYGLEPDGTVAPTIGVYCPIGSESSPIIQFFDSMGWHDLARRSLQYFLDKQHDDGLIQNFGGYMLETGAALWSMGEHYRYTRDLEWVRQVKAKLLKACEYLIAWRERNKKEGLRGRGYGMLDGKVADPNDPYHIFMLNGYAFLGLSRTAEMLADIDPTQSRELAEEAQSLKEDIRIGLFDSIARSPVVPLGDGSWCPTAAPWAEGNSGPLCLYAEPGKWYTHGTFFGRDSMLGPLYLVFQEVIAADEPVAGWLGAYQAEMMGVRNVAFSQPYYSRHPWVHLKRGEVNAFLKSYYNTLSALADRETYTFWEHFFHASPHKTHEEGWFLMETRCMLYMEEGESLRLLPGIPRVWLEDGKEIELDGVATYFGPLKLKVESRLSEDRIVAQVECPVDRNLTTVLLRLPHPRKRKAQRTTGGIYDPDAETVRLEPFPGKAEVVLEF